MPRDPLLCLARRGRQEVVRQPEDLFEDAAMRTIMTVCTMIIDYCLPMTLPHSTFSCCHHCSCLTGGRCTPSNHNFYFVKDNNFYNDDNQMLHFDDKNTQMQPESPGRPSIFPPQLQSPKMHYHLIHALHIFVLLLFSLLLT